MITRYKEAEAGITSPVNKTNPHSPRIGRRPTGLSSKRERIRAPAKRTPASGGATQSTNTITHIVGPVATVVGGRM